VPRRFVPDLNDMKRTDLAVISLEELEDLAWRWHELARSLANRAGEDSTTSSRPPSSDDPYRRDARGKPAAAGPDDDANASAAPPESAGKPDENKPDEKKAAKPAGKQPGAKGSWRCQPIVVSGEVEHPPEVCAACRAALGPALERRPVSAHNSLELVHADMALRYDLGRAHLLDELLDHGFAGQVPWQSAAMLDTGTRLRSFISRCGSISNSRASLCARAKITCRAEVTAA
jgi:transposase